MNPANGFLPLWFPLKRRSVHVTHQQPSRRSPNQSLEYYGTPGVFPPSARVDPKFKLQPRRPLHLWEYWKYATFLTSKVTELAADVLLHQIWGPRKKSWGIEMTIATSLARGAGRHTGLIDIGTVRMFMDIGGLVPLPSDALATPVTFRVKRQNLRGILEPLDAAETGDRQLSGEWVVGKKTWQRLQSEWKSSGIYTLEQSPNPRKERVVLYIHGGAYYLSSAAAQRAISIPLAKYTDARIFAIDYRLAPETQFPGPLHDVVCAYLRLVEDLHVPAENIIVSGDSAGGGLALAMLMYLRDNDYPLPSGAILMSPWVDLTLSCESWESNAMYDVVPLPLMDSHMNPIVLYLGEQMEKYLTHPYASPLFGSFEGLPPLLIQAGDAEVLRDEISLLAHKASLAGVLVRHEEYDDAIHVFQFWPLLSATRRAFESVGNFVHNILPKYQAGSLQVIGDTAEKGMEAEIENEKAVVVGSDGTEMQDGSAKQRFNEEESDLCLISSPLLSPTSSSEEEDPESDGYWEVEDVWEEDNWLRGDGEDGMVFPNYTRGGIPPRLPRELLRLNLVNGGKNNPPDRTGFTSVNLNFPSSSSPNSPLPTSSRQELSDDDAGYFLNPLGAPRRSKSASNLRHSFSQAGHDATRKHRNLKSQGSMPFPLSPSFPRALSMNTSSNSYQPTTPPSSPNVDGDLSIATRLYTLPSWVLIPSGEETKLKLKSHITLKSPQPVVSLTRCEM